MVVHAEDQEQIRPLAGGEGEVCFKKDLTEPTLLDIRTWTVSALIRIHAPNWHSSVAVLQVNRPLSFN